MELYYSGHTVKTLSYPSTLLEFLLHCVEFVKDYDQKTFYSEASFDNFISSCIPSTPKPTLLNIKVLSHLINK